MIKEQIKLGESIDYRKPTNPWSRRIKNTPVYSEAEILNAVYDISQKHPNTKIYSHCIEYKETTIGKEYVKQGPTIGYIWDYVACGPTEPGAIEYPIVKIECFLNVFLQ